MSRTRQNRSTTGRRAPSALTIWATVLVLTFPLLLPAGAQEVPPGAELELPDEAETVTVYALIDNTTTASTIAQDAFSLEGVVAASSEIGGLEFSDLIEIEAIGSDNEAVASRLSDELGVTVAPANTFMEISDDLGLAADPMQGNQWALKSPETDGGIGVYRAWHRTKGAGAVVAVADSGLARGHNEMQGVLWRNEDETPENGRDDDGNGFTDDTYGWDFVQDDNTPQETIGHGTAVASLIAARQNGTGISGAAPQANIMPLRVCPDRSCSMQAVIYAAIYAAENGADVLNLSLGGTYENGHPDVAVIRRVIRNVQERHGITVVAAAGNDSRSSADFELMPAESPGVIAAVATKKSGGFSGGFSNHGPGLEVAAPGQEVLVARTKNYPGTGDYTRTSGTSFSSPLTAATAALIKSANPGRTPGEVRAYIMQTVYEYPALQQWFDTGGIVNASLAVWAAKFNDVRGDVFIEDIAWLAHADITKGCNPPENNRYCPTWEITRGEMAAFLTRALDLPPANRDFFGDDNDSVFQKEINSIARAGITLGCNPPQNSRYCPDREVTREEMATFLAKALELPTANRDFFGDDNTSVHHPNINRLAASRITLGCNPPENSRFCPTWEVTRGQMAAFLRRGLTR